MSREAVTIELDNSTFVIIPNEISYISCVRKGKNKYEVNVIMKYTSHFPTFTVEKSMAEEILKALAPKKDKSNFLEHIKED